MKLRLTILKYHSWYLCQISLQIMLLPIQMTFEKQDSILMTRHYPDQGSAFWLNQMSQASRPIWSTTQIWVVTRHQYGISQAKQVRKGLLFLCNEGSTFLSTWVLCCDIFTLSVEPFSRLLDSSHTREGLCMNQGRSVSIKEDRCRACAAYCSGRYSFEPRPNSRALATAG